jgi:hypothetical protein
MMTMVGHPIFVLQKRIHTAAIVKEKQSERSFLKFQIGQGSDSQANKTFRTLSYGKQSLRSAVSTVGPFLLSGDANLFI